MVARQEVDRIFERLAELHRAGLVSLDRAMDAVETDQETGCTTPKQCTGTLLVDRRDFFACRILGLDDDSTQENEPSK